MPASFISFTTSKRSFHITTFEGSTPAFSVKSLLYQNTTWLNKFGRPTLSPLYVKASAAAGLKFSK